MSFLERAKNFLVEQAMDDVLDRICHQMKYICIFLAFSVYPLSVIDIKKVNWLPEPALWSFPVFPVFFLVASIVCGALVIYCYKILDKEHSQHLVSYSLQQNQESCLNKLVDLFQKKQSDMNGSARDNFAKDSEKTLEKYKKSLEETIKKLEKIDDPFSKGQLSKTTSLLEFMADFEAELDNLCIKCEEEQPVFDIAPLEACLNRNL